MKLEWESKMFTEKLKSYFESQPPKVKVIRALASKEPDYLSGETSPESGLITLEVGPQANDRLVLMALAHEAGHYEQWLNTQVSPGPLDVFLGTPIGELDAWVKGVRFARDWGVIGEYLVGKKLAAKEAKKFLGL